MNTTPRERAYWVQMVLDVWALRGNRWVQGTYAITNGGNNVSWAHNAARGYCLSGAIELVAGENLLTNTQRRQLYADLIETLHLDASDPFALEHWNDKPARVFADVREACQRTAYRLTQLPAGAWL